MINTADSWNQSLIVGTILTWSLGIGAVILVKLSDAAQKKERNTKNKHLHSHPSSKNSR